MNFDQKRTRPEKTGHRNYPFRQKRGNSLLWLIFLIGIATLFIITTPASAGEKYMAGSPVLSASIAGTNEFRPREKKSRSPLQSKIPD